MHPAAYFSGFDPGDAEMGSHRNLGNKHISILDDHDHVFGEKIRYSSEATSSHQVVAGVALPLLSRLEVLSILEYLEMRFGPVARLFFGLAK